MYAATAPELAGQSGAYLQDCAVAKPWRVARDAELARKVWEASEAAIAAVLAKAGVSGSVGMAGSEGGKAESEVGSDLLPPPSQRIEASP